MTQAAWADLSNALFFPTTFLLYLGAMFASFYGLAFTRTALTTDAPAAAGTSAEARAGRRGQKLATILASVGVVAHGAHIVTRSIASGGRVPLGNMFEFSSLIGFIVVVAALVVFQWRLKRPEVLGFLLFAGVISMAASLLLWTEPGPLLPILNSHWLKIHVFAIMLGFSVFVVGFTFNALYLLRDTAERRVAASTAAGGDRRSIGAAYAPGGSVVEDPIGEQTEGREDKDGGALLPVDEHDDLAYGAALRASIQPVRLALWSALVGFAAGSVFISSRPSATVGIAILAAVGALTAWRFLPSLPSAATLDSLAYRTISFGFPIWTFAVLAGAVWAQQSWGRYWGWDPKETSAFLTWVAYASYLHARATRGMKGRNAAIIGMSAFGVLWFTYFAVNLLITGLHSYAGL